RASLLQSTPYFKVFRRSLSAMVPRCFTCRAADTGAPLTTLAATDICKRTNCPVRGGSIMDRLMSEWADAGMGPRWARIRDGVRAVRSGLSHRLERDRAAAGRAEPSDAGAPPRRLTRGAPPAASLTPGAALG